MAELFFVIGLIVIPFSVFVLLYYMGVTVISWNTSNKQYRKHLRSAELNLSRRWHDEAKEDAVMAKEFKRERNRAPLWPVDAATSFLKRRRQDRNVLNELLGEECQTKMKWTGLFKR